MYEYNLTITFSKFNTNQILNRYYIILATTNKRYELNNEHPILEEKRLKNLVESFRESYIYYM